MANIYSRRTLGAGADGWIPGCAWVSYESSRRCARAGGGGRVPIIFFLSVMSAARPPLVPPAGRGVKRGIASVSRSRKRVRVFHPFEVAAGRLTSFIKNCNRGSEEQFDVREKKKGRPARTRQHTKSGKIATLSATKAKEINCVGCGPHI